MCRVRSFDYFEGRKVSRVSGRRIDNRHIPHARSRGGIKRHQARVCGNHIQSPITQGEPPVVSAATERVNGHLVCVTPAFHSGCRIKGNHVVVRRGEIHRSVGNKGIGWKRPEHTGLINPLRHQALHIVGRDLLKPAIALIGIAMPIGQPVVMVGVGVEQTCPFNRSDRSASKADDSNDRKPQESSEWYVWLLSLVHMASTYRKTETVPNPLR